jgi:hypothetical protein
MNEYEFRNAAAARTGARTAAAVDEGLRSYMLRVYNYMALGVAWTAIVAMFMAANPALMATVALGPMKWVLFIAIIGLGWFAPRLIFSGNAATAYIAYGAYATLWGVLISPMIAYFLGTGQAALVVRALLITAITFGATSLAGYVTKRDLSGFAGFFMMASIGLLVAIVVNALFFQSTMASLITSVLVVLLFAGITAWETQQIKEMYAEGDLPATARSKAIFGAFMLYGSFVTLFIHILNILGIMGGDE